MGPSQRLALKYYAASMILFGVMILAALLASLYYLTPSLLFQTLNFNIAKILHIDTLILWMLMGFMGGIYWFLPLELGVETQGIRLANVMFYVFCFAIVIVLGVFIFVQYGGSSESSLWFINQGCKYVEAPRWAAVGILLIFCAFVYNIVATVIKARKVTGIVAVLLVDLIPFVVFYLDAFPATTDMSDDIYWWWLVHMWVEATWEIIMACILALALMHLLNASRRIVEIWLYIEVALVLSIGALGLGQHYFWIGTPTYWLSIGGLFSAFEPLPLLGMVVHAVYDAGVHHMKAANRPAFFWILGEAFGNFIGAGIWGFMMTLPQINLFAHGTQWTVSHGHFSFWGAYGNGIICIIYIALQQVRQAARLDDRAWKWTFALLNAGMIGMVSALLIAGMSQAFYERAMGGPTLQAFMAGQSSPWFTVGMIARVGFGVLFAVGYIILIYDMMTIGKAEAAQAALEPA